MKPRVRVQAGDATGATARTYQAARPDRLLKFVLSGDSPARVLQRDLRGLIAHSREAARNNDYVRAWLGLISRNVIGAKGVQLQSLAKTAGGDADEAARKRIAANWREWGRRGNCTVCGRLSWGDVQRLAVVTAARDGLFLARHVRGRAAGRWAYRLKILSADHLALEMDRARLADGGYIRNGLEFDAQDRLAAAWLFAAPRDEGRTSARAVRVTASELLVFWRPEEPGQTIGRPWAHTALRGLQMLDKFEDAALASARWAANKLAFIEYDEAPAAAEPRPEGEAPPVEASEPGELGELPPGARLATFDPRFPDEGIGGFSGHMLRRAAGGLRTSYFTLSGDTAGMSFSNLRAALGEEREEWRELQAWAADHLCDVVFGQWLTGALLAQAMPGLDVTQRARLRPASWRPRTWASITPKEEATTWGALYALRALPPSAIAERMGEDYGDLLETWKADLAAMKDAKVPLPSDKVGDGVAGSDGDAREGDGAT